MTHRHVEADQREDIGADDGELRYEDGIRIDDNDGGRKHDRPKPRRRAQPATVHGRAIRSCRWDEYAITATAVRPIRGCSAVRRRLN